MDEQTLAWWQRQDMQGARALVLSSLAFSLMTVCVKQLGGRVPVSEIVLVRSLVSIALTAHVTRLDGYYRIYDGHTARKDMRGRQRDIIYQREFMRRSPVPK